MCVCLDFLKPKTCINKKVDKKMLLAEPKTQLFEKSCILGSGKKQVRNAHNLWTSEVHKSKRATGVLSLLPLDACIYENAPNILSVLSRKLTHLISLLFTPHALTPTPPSSMLCSALSVVSLSALSFV